MDTYFISAVLDAVLVSAAYYISQYFFDEKYHLNLNRSNKWITDNSVIVIGVLEFTTTLIIGRLRLCELSITKTGMTLLLFYGMSVLSVMDLKKKMIPNKVLLILLLLWVAIISIVLIWRTTVGIEMLCSSLVGGAIGGIIFLLCYLITKGQLGAGDVKLVFVMGLYLTGERIIGAILYGTIICCVYSVILLIRKKITKNDGIPMTPFLYLGTIITFLIL